MFKRYITTIRRYLSLGACDPKRLFFLFLTAILHNLSSLLEPPAAAKIVEEATNENYEMAFVWAIILLGCCLLTVALKHYRYKAYRENSVYEHDTLWRLLLKKITIYDENFTKAIPTSRIIDVSYNDVSSAHCVMDHFSDIISLSMTIIAAIIILFTTDVFIGLAVTALVIISFFALAYNLKKKDYYALKQKEQREEIVGLMGQVLDGQKEIKSFNMEDDINLYLDKYQKRHKEVYFTKRKYNDNADVLVPMVLGLGKVVTYFVMAPLILSGQFEVAALVLVIGHFENVEWKFWYLLSALAELSAKSVNVDRIHQVLNYKTKNMIKFGKEDIDNISGKVELKNVSFTYDRQQIMDDINLKFEPNSFTAIVGKSGSGKSTIFRLLLRLYKPSSGRILLDDIDIFDYTKEVYASNVAIVTQKPFVFDMTIRENLAMVDSNFEHIVAACKRAGIHDFIMGLKDGYNTKLVADAENISSGQKQLIALARTLLSRAEVLLFDEVTSSLDINTSKKIMKILKGLKRDHTILMITHKPQLMKIADEIIVIDSGRVVGHGKHSQLMKKNKYYQILQK